MKMVAVNIRILNIMTFEDFDALKFECFPCFQNG